MADKEIIIGKENDVLSIMWGTGVKGSPETSVSTTNTFSGAIVEGADNIPYSLEIEKLRFEKADEHMALSQKLDEMLTISDNITVIDTVKPKGATPYQIIDHYYDCILEGNDYDVKTDEKTAVSLKFKASSRWREWKELN